MPYIQPDQREPINKITQQLVEYIKELPAEEQDGALNYTITKMLTQLYPKKYFSYNRSLGVLTAVQQEWYRRRVAPYEDEKIQENGDV